MDRLLIAAVLACQPGHRLVDWRDKIPAGIRSADAIISVEPYYTRLSVYPPGHYEEVQRCCGGKPVSVLRIPLQDGRFCIGQSQPQMKWTLRLTVAPGLEL